MNKYQMMGQMIAIPLFLLVLSEASGAAYPPNLSGAPNPRQTVSVQQMERIRWRPNPVRGSATSTLSGGRRGTVAANCTLSSDEESEISLLVPMQSDGLVTTQAMPVVAWYVDTQVPVNMELVLSNPAQATPVYTQAISRADSGLVEISLPPLTVGTRYRWTVFMACHGGEGSEVYARSFIERTASTAGLANLAGLDQLEQAAAYAQAGIWYDALGSLLHEYAQTNQPNVFGLIQSLLAQVNPSHPLIDQ